MESVGRIVFFGNNEVKDWKEHNFSKALRITCLAIAIILWLVGLLTMCQVSGLSQIGTLGGGGIFALSHLFWATAYIKYVKSPCSFSTESSVLPLTSRIQRDGEIAEEDQISNLPQELQLRICQFLSIGDLSRLSRVSVHFHKFSYEDSLWNPPDSLSGSYPFYLENGVIKNRESNISLKHSGNRFIDLSVEEGRLFAIRNDGKFFECDSSEDTMKEIPTNISTKAHRFSAQVDSIQLEKTRIYTHKEYIVLIYSALTTKKTWSLFEVISLSQPSKYWIYSEDVSNYVRRVLIWDDKLFSLFPGRVRVDYLKATNNITPYIYVGQSFDEGYEPELIDLKVVGERLYTLSRDGIIYVHNIENGREMKRYQVPASEEGVFEGIEIFRRILYIFCERKNSEKKGLVYAIDLENESIVPYAKAS